MSWDRYAWVECYSRPMSCHTAAAVGYIQYNTIQYLAIWEIAGICHVSHYISLTSHF